jgi:hypothetical protein
VRFCRLETSPAKEAELERDLKDKIMEWILQVNHFMA